MLIYFSLRSLFFSSERKGVNLDVRGFGEELGEAGEGELVNIYCMRKASIFNKRGEF